MQRDFAEENKLKNLLKDCDFFCDAQSYICLDSTNTRAFELAENGALEGTVVLARKQTRGRGRLGRTFYSPSGSGLYMSLLLRPALSSEDSEVLTACAAVAVHRAILDLTGKKTKIKWVNDLYYGGKKLCGILAEGRFDGRGALSHLILGIGINLTPPEGGYHEEIAGKTTSLSEIAQDSSVSKTALCAEIICRFAEIYMALPSRDFLSVYRSESCLLGNTISFEKAGERVIAIAEDIDSQARLVVRLQNGTYKSLSAGEVTLVRPEEEDTVERMD